MSDQPPHPPPEPNLPPTPPGGWDQPLPPPAQGGWDATPPPPPGQGGWGQQPAPPPGWTPPGGPYGGPPPGGPYGGPPAFEATQAIAYGWRAFRNYAGVMIGATLFAFLIPGVLQGIGTVVGGGEIFQFSAEAGSSPEVEFNPLTLVFNVAVTIVSLVISAVVLRLVLDIVDGNQVSFGGMFTRINFVQVLIAAVVLGIATFIGALLCVLPGLAVIFLTFFTNHFIVAKGESAFQAIGSSFRLVSANLGQCALLALLGFLCALAGLLACCIGLFVAVPVISIAGAFAFRRLQNEPAREF